MSTTPEARPAAVVVTDEMVEAAARTICCYRGVNPDCQHQTYPGDSLFTSPDGYWPERKGYFPSPPTPWVWGWCLKAQQARAILEAALALARTGLDHGGDAAEMIGEVERLTAENERLRLGQDYLRLERDEASARAAKAVEVLRHVEWAENYGLAAKCPVCLKFRRNGHAPNCSLAALLSDHPAPEPSVEAGEVRRCKAPDGVCVYLGQCNTNRYGCHDGSQMAADRAFQTPATGGRDAG